MDKETQTIKKFNYKTVMLFFLILIMLGVMTLLQGKDSFFNLSKKSRIKMGLPAPDFSFPGLNGQLVRLSDYRNKVVLLNIWATWCPPCVEEMPSMEKLYQVLTGRDFEILAVSIDKLGTKAVTPFIQKYKLTFPALIDSEGTIQNIYGTTGVPESFIIDRKGVIRQVVIGPIDWYAPEVIRFIQNLLEQPYPKK